jgi:hypothetical protein
MSQVMWVYGGRRERVPHEAEIHKMGIIQIIRCCFMRYDFFLGSGSWCETVLKPVVCTGPFAALFKLITF